MTTDGFVLHGFILIHTAMRRDAYRLAGACAAATTDDELRALARWYVRFHLNLEDHHRAEDDIFFPQLRERAPELAGGLDQLDEDHHQLAAAFDALDKALSALDRAAAAEHAAHLAKILDDHLVAEEQLVVAATARLMTADEQRALEKGLQKAARISQIAFVLPWVLGAAHPDERDQLMKEIPLPLRVLHGAFWRRSYARLSRPLAAGDAAAAEHLGGVRA